MRASLGEAVDSDGKKQARPEKNLWAWVTRGHQDSAGHSQISSAVKKRRKRAKGLRRTEGTPSRPAEQGWSPGLRNGRVGKGLGCQVYDTGRLGGNNLEYYEGDILRGVLVHYARSEKGEPVERPPRPDKCGSHDGLLLLGSLRYPRGKARQFGQTERVNVRQGLFSLKHRSAY